MTSRILPRDEWPKLAGTELETALEVLQHEEAHIIVVEDGDRIVGCWAAVRYVHLEGVWVHPDYRRRGSVIRRLLVGGKSLVMALGARVFWTAAMTPEIEDIVTRIGGVPLPEAKHFVVRV